MEIIIDKNNVPHLLTNNVDNLIITNNNNIVSYRDEKMKGNCDIDINTNEVFKIKSKYDSIVKTDI